MSVTGREMKGLLDSVAHLAMLRQPISLRFDSRPVESCRPDLRQSLIVPSHLLKLQHRVGVHFSGLGHLLGVARLEGSRVYNATQWPPNGNKSARCFSDFKPRKMAKECPWGKKIPDKDPMKISMAPGADAASCSSCCWSSRTFHGLLQQAPPAAL